MSLFIGLWKQSKNIKSWIINILKVLGRVLWLSNVWLKGLQLDSSVYWKSRSLLPFPSSETTKQHKISIHTPQPAKLLGYHGEKLCCFTILLLSHLLKTWPRPAVMVSVPGYCQTACGSLMLGLDPDEIANVAPTVQQGELLWAPTATEVSVWEGQHLMWLGLLCSSLIFSPLLHVLLFWLLPFWKIACIAFLL